MRTFNEQQADSSGRKGTAVAILGRVERYLRKHDIPHTKFGRLAVGDPRLVGDLRNGRELRPATQARVEAFMADGTEHRA